MMKRVYILALLLLSVLVVPALSVSGEDGPVIVADKINFIGDNRKFI